MGQILDGLAVLLFLLTTVWALLYCPLVWPHLGRQKPDASKLLLGVVMPRWRAWCLGCDILAIVIVAASSCLIVAGWVWFAATGASVAHFFPLFALFGVCWRVSESRPLFATTLIEIREQGIACMGSFWPWDQVESYSWDDTPEATLRLKCVGYLGSYQIAPKQKEELETLLRQNLPSATES